MEYKETDEKGSFDAWGSGLKYVYESEKKRLRILSTRNRKRPLLEIPFDHDGFDNPYAYVRDVNKATQIYAMMISNNETVNLEELLSDKRLTSILQSSVRIAKYSHYLKTEDFYLFAEHFCEHFGLRDLKIRRVQSRASKRDVYIGKLRTLRNRSTKAISGSLHQTIKDLSEKTVSELIAEEQWSVRQQDAYNLLSVSTNLATISHILDKRFSPHKRIAKYANMSDTKIEKNKKDRF